MTEPIAFTSITPNVGLPLLFAGQAQKEFYVNQALTILDALAQQAVVASLPQPPANADDGSCYRIAAPATGEWSGHADRLAIRIAGSWHLVTPAQGMMMFDRAAGVWLCFRSEWQSAPALAAPDGGAVIDVEARTMLAQLVAGLRSIGLIAPPAG
jgi:Protein of unknown function (DUF2793)